MHKQNSSLIFCSDLKIIKDNICKNKKEQEEEIQYWREKLTKLDYEGGSTEFPISDIFHVQSSANVWAALVNKQLNVLPVQTCSMQFMQLLYTGCCFQAL